MSFEANMVWLQYRGSGGFNESSDVSTFQAAMNSGVIDDEVVMSECQSGAPHVLRKAYIISVARTMPLSNWLIKSGKLDRLCR
jgi:hypothetical protein